MLKLKPGHVTEERPNRSNTNNNSWSAVAPHGDTGVHKHLLVGSRVTGVTGACYNVTDAALQLHNMTSQVSRVVILSYTT